MPSSIPSTFSNAPETGHTRSRITTPSLPVFFLILVELVLLVSVIWLGDTPLRVIALVLGPVILAGTVWSGRGRAGGSRLQAVLQHTDGERMDISAEVSAGEETPELQAYARMTSRLREMIVDFQQQSLNISVSSARSRLLAERASREAGGQQNLAEQIFQASNETTSALGDVTSRTAVITDMNSRNLEVAQVSGQQLGEARVQVQTINDAMAAFQQNISELDQTSGQIQNILKTVQDFSEQTNMLALNAAIEAARAGELGRGFAVVADEVRNLSIRVGEAASQINTLLGRMIEAMSEADRQAQQVVGQSEAAGQATETAASQFEAMVADFRQAHEDLLMVSSALEELTAANNETHQHASGIRDSSQSIREGMGEIFTQTDALRDNTNLVLQALCRFRLGEGHLEMVANKLFARRDQMQAAMEELADQGVDLFDFNYREIPDTGGQKFTTSWWEAFAGQVQPMLDEWDEGGKDGIIYTLPTDHHGYLPIARSVSAQPMTGDPRVDMVRSTHQRITVQGQELENLRKCTFLSMGTFVLPGTMTVVIVIYVPLVVHGRRWGVMTTGVHPDALGIGKV